MQTYHSMLESKIRECASVDQAGVPHGMAGAAKTRNLGDSGEEVKLEGSR